MEDKEVGRLWATVRYWCEQPFPPPYARTYEMLIRKLVEERAEGLYDRGETILSYDEWDRVQDKFIEMALRDFGIDPKTYPGDKP